MRTTRDLITTVFGPHRGIPPNVVETVPSPFVTSPGRSTGSKRKSVRNLVRDYTGYSVRKDSVLHNQSISRNRCHCLLRCLASRNVVCN